jgi:LPXTG-motif cell wall-anchored protein
MSFAMFWVVAMGIAVVGFGWVKIRRRRKAAHSADPANVVNAA